MQGFVAVPILVGYDEDAEHGRIFSFDSTGEKYDEQRFASIGSGSVFARGSLKKLYRDGMTAQDVALVLMHALYDAADDDSARAPGHAGRGLVRTALDAREVMGRLGFVSNTALLLKYAT
jgi:20S proteasome alpha/beta subunit